MSRTKKLWKNYSFEDFLTERNNPNEKKRKLCVSDVPVYLKTINGISKIVWQVSLFCGETRLSPFQKNQTRKNGGFGRWEFSLEIFCTRLTTMSTNGQVRSFCIYKTTFITINFDFTSELIRVFLSLLPSETWILLDYFLVLASDALCSSMTGEFWISHDFYKQE